MPDSELARAFAALDDAVALQIVRQEIAAGQEPLSIVQELQSGMEIFADQCRTGDFFISDLILAGEIFQQSMVLLEPGLKQTETHGKGPGIVLGTVKGDIHNLGKDILAILLKASGFEVYDLGVNVAPEVFVLNVQETGCRLLGLSGLITPSFDAMKDVIQAMEAAGLRSQVKIIIGGGVVTELARAYSGADAFANDAMQGVAWFQKTSQEQKDD